MVIKTISLKLHSPSKKKREIMDDALERYSLSFAHLIEGLRERFESGDTPAITKQTISKLSDKKLLQELNAFGAQPFKDALLMDVAMTLAGYQAQLKGSKIASYPTSRLEDDGFSDRFAVLCEQYQNRKEFLHAYESMLKKHRMLRPLLFCRHDKSRDYCLLYDSTNDRFYAKMYLVNYKMAQSPCRTAATPCLRYVDKDATEFRPDSRQRRYIVVPLAFGKWQEEFLKKALIDPSLLKTAQLVKKGNAYYLNIKIACPVQQNKAATSFMGVCRSLKSYAHYTVVRENERFSGYIFSPGDARANQTVDANLLHRLSNAIVATAASYNSQLVLYALGDKYDSIEHGTQQPLLSKGSYNALCAMLSYKAELAGLQKLVVVSPVGVFRTCPVCGKNSRKNRMNEQLFLCTNCGHTCSVEELGSINLALRIQSYKQSKISFTIQENEGTVRFFNKVLDCEFVTAAGDSMYSNFYDFLKQYVDTNITVGANKKRSMLKKLSEYEDIKDGIHFAAN